MQNTGQSIEQVKSKKSNFFPHFFSSTRAPWRARRRAEAVPPIDRRGPCRRCGRGASSRPRAPLCSTRRVEPRVPVVGQAAGVLVSQWKCWVRQWVRTCRACAHLFDAPVASWRFYLEESMEVRGSDTIDKWTLLRSVNTRLYSR